MILGQIPSKSSFSALRAAEHDIVWALFLLEPRISLRHVSQQP